MEKKLKVVWICHFSNQDVRKQMRFSINPIERYLRKITGYNINVENHSDYAQWITNGINTIKNHKNIELHVISPHNYLDKPTSEFYIDDVFYHFFRPSNVRLFSIIYNKLFSPKHHLYKANTKSIKTFISNINPDIIHLYGPENPYYAISVLSVSTVQYPLLVSLQTLMNHPTFIKNKSMLEGDFFERLNIEKKILQHTNYISTGVQGYGDYILKNINSNAYIFKGSLAVGEAINITPCDKKYDFVFFANNISKGIDETLQAFVIAKKKRPTIILNVFGSYNADLKDKLDQFLKQNNCFNSVIFSGRMPTHDDVLQQIKQAKIAIIPLKIDFVSSSIREAMSCGVPVISTITEGTPTLNTKRESILLSKIGDYEAMANNMVKLFDNPKYAEMISKNALITVQERYGNEVIIDRTISAYKAIIEHFKREIPISKEIAQTKLN